MRLGKPKRLQVNPKTTRTNLICVSRGGNPAASFTWHRNGQRLLPNESVAIHSSEQGRSQLSLLSKLLRTRDTLTCAVTNSAMQLEMDHYARSYWLGVEVQVAQGVTR